MPPSQHNTAQKSALSPELKGWLDRVVVPALVREYVAEMQREKTCAQAGLVTEFAATRTAIAEEGE